MKKKWLQIQPVMIKIPRGSMRLRQWGLNICNSPWFERLIVFFIILNTIILTLKWNDMSQSMITFTEKANFYLSMIFLAEAIIKIFALRTRYFMDNWNLFDFLVVAISLVGFILDQTLGDNSFGSQATIARAFRVLRILRIIKQAKTLRMVIDTLLVTLP